MTDFFALLSLSRTFALSEADLSARYMELQRLHHPDRAVGKSAKERAASVAMAMQINDAYETLKSPLARAQHLLELQGIRVNSDDDTVRPDQALLMEMMEIREQLQGAEDGPALKRATDDLKAAARRCMVELEGAFATEAHDRAAQLTLRMKYLEKALEEAHTRYYMMKSASEDVHASVH